MWLIVLTSCATTPPESTPSDPPAAEQAAEVKAPGNLPVMSEGELSAAEAARQACIDGCIRDNQMRAVSPQEIRVDCERECDAEHFTGQVEVSEPLSAPLPSGTTE